MIKLLWDSERAQLSAGDSDDQDELRIIQSMESALEGLRANLQLLSAFDEDLILFRIREAVRAF